MERLTFEGNFCDIAQCDVIPGGSYCESGSCTQRKVWERLAAYEDTGLTPERCAEFARADAEGRYIVMRDTKQEGVARLRELADADKDGRLVVLPCKVCDTVYLIVTKRARVYMPEFRFIKKSKLTFLNMERILQDFGKTVSHTLHGSTTSRPSLSASASSRRRATPSCFVSRITMYRPSASARANSAQRSGVSPVSS